MRNKPKFKPGDRVIFRPRHSHYTEMEWHFRDDLGVVLDSSDLPNVRMTLRNNGVDMITVDQRDLVPA